MPSPARPRHVAFSHKQKKLQLQTKRALKRGEDVETLQHGRNGRIRLDRSAKMRSEAHDGLELHSRFMSIPHDYLLRTREAAWSEELPRPIPDSSSVFPLELVDNPAANKLTVPSRPPFHLDQTKSEVEENEETMFREWIRETRDITKEWIDGGDNEPVAGPSTLRSPSSFETNLEVWRQLWRVVEASSIVLLLVDARCPAVHCPPSLRAYLRSLRPRREIILVLTKSDLVDPSALVGWRSWLKAWWLDGSDGDEHEPQVVSVSSYDTSLLHTEGRHRPHIPNTARVALLEALQLAHARLLSSPEHNVRETVHWDDLNTDSAHIEDETETRRRSGEPTHDETEPPLTFGLVGQPNVGKSSLLNALLGTTKVRASRTPGKTKHWQTILWGARREVRIVDCPGLVCPSVVPMELQAMSGILPIAQIPSLPACIQFAGRLLPLERVFRIPEPEQSVDELEAKKTWRGPHRIAAPAKKGWTAGDLMDGRAADRGFMTAKSARPDANRAADGMLRALAEGRVRWGFWPPGSEPTRDGQGLWLGEWQSSDSEFESGSLSEDSDPPTVVTVAAIESDDDEEDEIDDESPAVKLNNASFFAALSLDNDDEDDDEDDEDDYVLVSV